MEKEKLLSIVTNTSLTNRERKNAALELITKHPETREYRFCKSCGRPASEIRREYKGIFGDMYYYQYTCVCGASNSMPEDYGDGLSVNVNEIAFMNLVKEGREEK